MARGDTVSPRPHQLPAEGVGTCPHRRAAPVRSPCGSSSRGSAPSGTQSADQHPPEPQNKPLFVPLRVLADDKADVRVVLAAMAGSQGVCGDAPELTTVVVKCCRLEAWDSGAHARRELAALRRVSEQPAHPNVVGLIDVLRDESYIYLIMPYMDGGDLFEYMRATNAGLTQEEAKRFFAHVTRGLQHLQRLGIAHGDVSLENVMLSNGSVEGEEPTAHLIDLGSCCFVDSEGMCPAQEYQFRGKLGYIPPELMMGDPAVPVDAFAVDVWGLGVCLYALITGRPLYVRPDDAAFQVLCEGRADELIDHYGNFLGPMDPLAKDLICSMLRPEPSSRPCLEEVLLHPWLHQGGEA